MSIEYRCSLIAEHRDLPLSAVLNEPVRGMCPDPSLLSLPGIDLIRAYMRGQIPAVPVFRLFGGLATQASAGTSVLLQPISPWFDVNNGFVDLTVIAEYAAHNTALTAAPPAVHIRTVDLSVRYLRPCTVDDESVVARGRILHSGSSFTTVDVLMEDALGRLVGQASVSVVFAPMDPPPPPLTRPLDTIEEPSYTTPDPPKRPLPPRPPMHFAGGELAAMPPFADFLGVELSEVSDKRVCGTLPASPWFSRLHPEVAPGVMGAAADLVAGPAIAQILDTEFDRLAIINSSHSFLVPVPADGRPLSITSSVGQREGELFIVSSRIVDARGRLVMVGHGPAMVRPRRAAPPRRSAERVLVTVLFTDVVGSTERVRELGDSKWSELLDEHRALVRRKLSQLRGREINTTGDGFLCTFDSPTRAVECARAIRSGVGGLGLEVRIGIHTGECEINAGDLSGVAVHVASRFQSAASPGEILISNTVKDLIAGSGVAVVDRGTRELKGLEGTWSLFAVE